MPQDTLFRMLESKKLLSEYSTACSAAVSNIKDEIEAAQRRLLWKWEILVWSTYRGGGRALRFGDPR